MRIQHNIMAMNAYRNYNTNTSALSKNLEKLSSGYKINRAGDDAAGLAISEKMRAQITGLEGAQSNAKDGISLVQTAEGALTEVHDMLNRMYELAEQSANGTYEDEVDRVQLQKEVDNLTAEINRIADSSNFNGINLLDGSLTAIEGAQTVSQLNSTDAATAAGGDAFEQVITFGTTAAANTTMTMELKYLDKDGNVKTASVTFTTGAASTAGDMASGAESALQSIFGDDYTVAASGAKVTITANENGADQTAIVSMTLTGGSAGTDTIGTATAGKDDFYTITPAAVGDTFTVDGTTYEIVKQGGTAKEGNKALYVEDAANTNAAVASMVEQLKDYGVDATASTTNIQIAAAGADATGKGGLSLQIGDTGEDFNQLNVSINDCHADALGIDNISIATQEGAQAALATIKNAINYVSDVRGGLGAIQNRLDHTINNLSVMQENIQDAESSIRDTDIADEMMDYTKNNILIQSAQAMLAQANQVPQGVLQLLQ